MGERLTIDELRERYDGEWVALVDFENDPESDEITVGRVIAHGPDRDAFDNELDRLRPRSFAVECFKSLPAGWGLAL